MKLPLVSCPKCNTPVEIRFGRSTTQFLAAHVYRPSCPLSNRIWLKLGTDRTEAIVECRKRIMEETTDLPNEAAPSEEEAAAVKRGTRE